MKQMIFFLFEGLLVVDLRVPPDSRTSMEWNVGIDTVRIFLYNIVTSILLFVFSKRFESLNHHNLVCPDQVIIIKASG